MENSGPALDTTAKRILIVDDDEVLVELLQTALTAQGYRVSSCSNGHEALRALSSSAFDLVLLDVWMPGMNGLELLAELSRLRASVRVIVMTQDSTPETLLTAIRQHAHDYIAKPFDLAALLELVEDTITHPVIAGIEVLSAKSDWVELLAPCDLQTAGRIQGFMTRLAVDLPEEVRTAIAQVFRELLTNAVEWGGKLDSRKTVRIAYLRTPRMVQYRIADPGTGFRFDELKHAAINNPEDDPLKHTIVREQQGIRPGGLGMVIVRGLADELVYNEKQNEVLFIKYIGR